MLWWKGKWNVARVWERLEREVGNMLDWRNISLCTPFQALLLPLRNMSFQIVLTHWSEIHQMSTPKGKKRLKIKYFASKPQWSKMIQLKEKLIISQIISATHKCIYVHFIHTTHTCEGDTPKSELSSGEQVPCSAGFPGQGSVLGAHLYQCTRRVVRGYIPLQWVFSKPLSMHLPISWWAIYEHLPTPHGLFSSFDQVFDQKWHDPHAPPSHPEQLVFVSPDEKNLQREMFLLMWKRWNKKQQKH